MQTRRLAGLLVIGVSALAPGVSAQSVQLPSYSYFGVGTSVLVPDRGSTFLGGVNRAAAGTNDLGVPLLPFAPFSNRGIGQDRSASHVGVSVFIHDFETMEAAIAREASRSSTLHPRLPVAQYPLPPREPASRSSLPSVTEIRRRGQSQQVSREEEALDFFRRGERAEAEGKATVARIYYQMVIRRASDDLRSQAMAKLAEIR